MSIREIETSKINAVKSYLDSISPRKSISELCENLDTDRFRPLFSDRMYNIIDHAFITKNSIETSYRPVINYITHNNKSIITEKHGETSFEVYGNTFPVRIRINGFIPPKDDSAYFLDILANTNRNTVDTKQCAIAVYDAVLEMFRKGISQKTDPKLMELAKYKRYSESHTEKTLANIITLCDNAYQDKLASYMSDIIYINFENDKIRTKWQDNMAYTELVKLYNVYNDFHQHSEEDFKDAIAEYKDFGLDHCNFSDILHTGVSELESKLGLVLADCQYNAWQRHGICIRAYIWIHHNTI